MEVRTHTGSRAARCVRGLGGGLPREFWVLWTGTLVNRLGYVVEPFLALYLVRERGLTPAMAGVVLAAFGAGATASQPLGGWLADRVGRRQTLAAGMAATALAMLGLAAAPGLGAIAVLSVALGLAVDLYRPASAALVADLVAPAERPRAFALTYWAVNLGVAVAAFVGGALAQEHFRLLFVLDAATCVAFAVLVLVGIPETRDRSGGAHPVGGSGYGTALRDRLLLALTGVTLLSATVYLQSFVTLPLAMRADGLPPVAYGIAYAVNPIAVLVLAPLTLGWLTRLPPVPVMAASVVAMGLGFGATALVSDLPGYAATVLLWTIGEVGVNSVGPALVADIAPADQRGRYNGVVGLAYGGAAVLAPLVGTLTLQHLGGAVLWGGCLAACVLAAGWLLVLAPALQRRRAMVSA